jgi:small subunit ribosomal protein S20
MAITHAAQKALRKSVKREAVNIKRKDNLKSLVKEVRLLVSQKKTKEAKELLNKVYQILDKSAKTGIIKKNTASRKKSRIAKLLNKN